MQSFELIEADEIWSYVRVRYKGVELPITLSAEVWDSEPLATPAEDSFSLYLYQFNNQIFIKAEQYCNAQLQAIYCYQWTETAALAIEQIPAEALLLEAYQSPSDGKIRF